MASYIYSKVQEAIGGKSTSSGFQKSWSPNKIRALYIMRNFIMVVDYLQGPRVLAIDENEVGMDLQNPNRVGSLNNLLSSRQLSCLEEIYADEAFSRYVGVLDLKAYADSVLNSASRLRYYAYTSGINGEALRQAYLKAFQEGQVDFTYAKNIGGIRYVDTGNVEWYKRHNLRPQYYGPDAEGGSLAAWFNKVEKIVSKYAQAEMAKVQLSKDCEYIINRLKVDVAGYSALVKLRSLMKFCASSGYELHKVFYKIAEETQKAPKPVPGLSKEKIIAAVKATWTKDVAFIKTAQGVANYYGYADLYLKDAPFDLQKLESSSAYPEEGGFLQIGIMLDRILAGLYEKYGSNPLYKYTINVAIMSEFPEGIPNGSLAKRLAGKGKVIERSPLEFVPNYLKAFNRICGVDDEFLEGGDG